MTSGGAWGQSAGKDHQDPAVGESQDAQVSVLEP